jgi:hypothetical protein
LDEAGLLLDPGSRPRSIKECRVAGLVFNPGLEPRACARGQWTRSDPRFPRDQIRVALELTCDIADDGSEIPSVNRGHEVAARPADGPGGAPIGACRRARLCKPHKVAYSSVRAEADDEMYVIRQDGTTEHSHAGRSARARHGTVYVARCGRVHTPGSLPGMPGNVSVHLVGVVVRHLVPGAVVG